MAKAAVTLDELASALGTALVAAKGYKATGDLEATQIEFIGNLLTDAVTRLAILPDLVDTRQKADDVSAARAALDAAEAAQRG